MRKISKSRADDDVVSSTNGSGSLGIEDQEADQSVEREEDKSGSKDKNDSINDGDSDDSKELVTSKSKTKSKKRKSGKNNKTNDDDDQTDSDLKQNDDTADDVDSVESKETPKKKPKSESKAKSKKGKSGRETKKNVAEEEEYEVERIVDSKRIKGKLHYLIRWKGYSADSDSWEPHDTLSCPDVINKYNEEKEIPPKKSNKRKAKKKETKVPAKRAKTNWDSENADENAEYEVERILEVHHKKNGDREFLIHWKGWSSKFDSWEPEKNLNCPDLIKRFMDKVSVARSSTGRNLRVAPETTNRFTLQDPSSGRRLSKRRGQRQRVRYDDAE
ncbi:chromo domain protein LHP1-like [Colias croceus]|uniref:chromo domain protein LHP1-like n=1 Tax=Colias crocea TaxID=72248 RepID=UPI001E27E4A4|nr:chromo domain protein LHP1-like [Colias croceus]